MFNLTIKSGIIIIFIPLLTWGQNEGIRFDKSLSWQAIRAKAKEENKYIFLDCYTTWCGPCKEMDRNVYPLKEVGDYFNAHFVSVSVQMDKTSGDSKYTKDWYSAVDELRIEYGINAFPSYLFFSPDGTPVHRFVGSELDIHQFIAKAQNALNPEMQYYTLMNSWEDHRSDSVFLSHAIRAAVEADDNDHVAIIGKAYLASMLNQPAITKENIEIISRLIKSSADREFSLFLNNTSAINSLMGEKNYAEKKIGEIIFKEEVFPLFNKQGIAVDWDSVTRALKKKYPQIDEELLSILNNKFAFSIQYEVNNEIFEKNASPARWDSIQAQLNREYPGFNCSVLLQTLKKRYYPVRINVEIDQLIQQDQKDSVPDWNAISENLQTKFPEFDYRPLLFRKEAFYYEKKKQWPAYEKAIYSLFSGYSDHFSDYLITENEATEIVWAYILMHSENKKLLEEGLRYLRHLTHEKPMEDIVENDVDTYANLLYKMGHVNEAIHWENKAIMLVTQRKGRSWVADLAEFKSNLKKMEKGEKTWAE